MAQPLCADLDWLILSQRNTGETSGGEHHTITDTQRIGEWCPEVAAEPLRPAFLSPDGKTLRRYGRRLVRRAPEGSVHAACFADLTWSHWCPSTAEKAWLARATQWHRSTNVAVP
jgi:hypothetical protein